MNFNPRNGYWEMKVNLKISEYREKLEQVPGLMLAYDSNLVRGMPDALAAAARRLGGNIQPPPKEATALPLPITIPLYRYQLEGVQRLYSILIKYGGALLADDLGLGKSMQTIALFNQLPQPSRNLIIAPRFMSEGWADELTKWGEPDYAMLRAKTTKANTAQWEKGKTAKWAITSYEMLEAALTECFSDQPPDAIAFDESQMLKNIKAGRTKKALEAAAMINFKLAITGTPMDNRPSDFYGTLKVLFGSRFGSRTSFFTEYCGGTINGHGGLEATGLTNQDELKERLGYYMVRREKRDVLKELPPLRRQVMWVEEDSMASKLLKAAVLNKKKNAMYLAVKATAAAKMDLAIELASQAKRFFLVTYERADAMAMSRRLDLQGTPNVCIHGGIPVEKRHALIKAAILGRMGIVATLDSTKGGINLQGAAHIGIMHALDWMPLKMAQVEARIHRIGQTEHVLWYYLACKESADELIVRTVIEKLDQWRALLGQNSNRDLRDDLGGNIGGGPTEEQALAALYEAL